MKRGIIHSGLSTLILLSTASASDKPKRIWTADLNSASEVQKAGPVDENTHTFVTFVNQTHVAAALLFPLRVNGVWPERDETQRSHLLILILDAENGKVLHSRYWDDLKGEAASAHGFEVQVANSGELIVMVGNELLRLSSELEIRVQRTLPRTKEERNGLTYYDHWSLAASPVGRSALLVHRDIDRGCENHWISTDDLTDESVNPTPHCGSSPIVMTKDSAVFNVVQPRRHRPPLMKQDRAGVLQPLCTSCDGAVFSAFGKDLLLLGTGHAASYAIIDLEGREICRGSHGFGADRILQTSGSSVANRVAFLYGSLRGSLFHSWRGSDKIIVVDADKKNEVASIHLSDKGTSIASEWKVFITPRLALSPDGKELAVLREHVLELMAIP